MAARPVPRFGAYMESVEAKTHKTRDELWKIAQREGFVKKGRFVARHSDVVKWLKSNLQLGHVHASFLTTYFRLRAKDPTLSAHMRKWARTTDYDRKKVR
jgi:hypothetical protein